ncbi:MAG TPA: hypothetical protein VMW72_16625 [Sedimentisphaerales bacterium]|nr:hypothetical protein [Sedimentisphaerales bacterium]
MDEDSHTARAVTHRFLRGLGIGGLAVIASLGFADRVHATYFHSDVAGDYLDRGWYYLLDDGQYYFLDRGQYNILGGLSYQLGHPCYPKLFERNLDQAIEFTKRVNTGWFSIGGGQVPIGEYAVWSRYFNAGDYVDRRRYYFLDKGQYYYLDREQYNLLGGLGYSFGWPYYQIQYDWSFYQFGKSGQCPIPEPSTVGFLVLGALVVLGSKKYRKER